MARSPANTDTPTTIRRRRGRLIPSSFTLAIWRLRQTWRLLLIVGLGDIAAVLLVCIVPLFTQVALSAGVRGVIDGQPGASQIFISGFAQAPSQQDVATIQQRLDSIIASDMGAYVVAGEPNFSVSLPFVMLPPNPSSGSGATSGGQPQQLQVVGADLTQAATQYTLIAGRLPSTASDTLEIALTQADATTLNTHVGAILHAQIPGGPQATNLDMRVVGIVIPPAGSNQSQNQQFQKGSVSFGSGSGAFGGPSTFSVLASNQAILAWTGRACVNRSGTAEWPSARDELGLSVRYVAHERERAERRARPAR